MYEPRSAAGQVARPGGKDRARYAPKPFATGPGSPPGAPFDMATTTSPAGARLDEVSRG